jgi:ribosomal protein L11 methyltransferase
LTDSPLVHYEWLEIEIDIHPVTHDAVSAFLFDLGCQAVVSRGSFKNTTLHAYLPLQKGPKETRDKIGHFLLDLMAIFPEAESYSFRFKKVKDKDWSLSWRKFFHLDRVTPLLTIIPAWEEIPESITGHIIRIDPGPAFGTGQHATTRLCLMAMEEIHFDNGWTMLDVGTGSGILAIYGAKLGACKVVGIDIDPVALRWAKNNISLNGFSKKIELSIRPIEKCKESFSLITANLTRNLILALLGDFNRVLTQGGRLILSGILREQIKQVEEALSRCSFQTGYSICQEEWACLIVEKMNNS